MARERGGAKLLGDDGLAIEPVDGGAVPDRRTGCMARERGGAKLLGDDGLAIEPVDGHLLLPVVQQRHDGYPTALCEPG